MRRALLPLLAVAFACAPKKPEPHERPSVDPGTAGAAVAGVPGAVAPSDPRERRLLEAEDQPDPAARAKALAAIAADAPPSDHVGRLARIALVRALAEAGDLAGMEAAAGQVEIEDDAEGADLLNRMAFAAAEKGGDADLDRALPRARRAVEIVDSMRRPPHLDAGLFKRQTAATTANYRDTLGWVLVRQGNADQGLETLLEASRALPEDPSIAFHLGEAYAALGRQKEAASAFEWSLAGDGPESERARKRLETLPGVDASSLMAGQAAAVMSMRLHVRSHLPDHAVDEPARELAAKDEKGEPIRLAPLRGKPVVLAFLSDASEPSRRALEALRSASAAGAQVRALSEDTADRTVSIGVPFPVGRDPEGVDAGAFGVHVLPTVLVLDADGRVKYRNEGIVPGFGMLVDAELEALDGKRISP